MIPPDNFEAVRAVDLYARIFPFNFSYVEPGILVKGGTLLLGGVAKIGKSILMIELARALTLGKPLFDNPDYIVPEKKRVLYIEAENGPRSVKERGLKMQQDDDPYAYEDRFWIISCKNPPQLNRLKVFEEQILKVRPHVIIIDPISFFHEGEENSNTDVNRVFYALNHLKTINPEDETAIVIAHHFGRPPWGKAKDGYDPLSSYNFRGASKWKDGADSILTMHRYAELNLGWEAWRLKMRLLCRHCSSPPDSFYNVNTRNDLRIRFEKNAGKEMPVTKKISVLGTNKQGSLLEELAKEKEKLNGSGDNKVLNIRPD